MVTTRRKAAAPAESSQAAAAMMEPTLEPARPRRAGRKVAPAQTPTTTAISSSTTSVAVSTTIKTNRRTRSKATASPFKSLDEPLRVAKTTQNKRKRNTPRVSATPELDAAPSEPAANESDDEGLFFKQSMPQISSPPTSTTIPIPTATPEVVQSTATDARYPQTVYLENVLLKTRLADLEFRYNVVSHIACELRHKVYDFGNENCNLRIQINELLAGQAKVYRANQPQPTDYDSFMDGTTEPTPARAEFITGSESALALLHHIESAAREPRTIDSENEDEADDSRMSQRSSQPITRAEDPRNAVTPTPSPRPVSLPTGFFSRSFSALKSKLGFSTATPPEPAPTPSRAPPPNTITEALSAPPTPVGERKKVRHKKKKQSPMMRLLTKGVEPREMKIAEEWAKHAIPALMNDAAFDEKRRRLETPLLIKDLNNFPSSKPWETGFGDPLGDMDDEEAVPVWAVYLDILAEAEEPKKKKTKTDHEVSMDTDDTLSLNDIIAASNSAQTSRKLYDSHGNSASIHDFHPRRSVEPSPMFGSPVSHQQGNNIFRERQGQEATTQIRNEDRNTLHEATQKVVPHHDPLQGSFGLDYDSDDDDTTIIGETGDGDAAASPLWTQPPPPAPVPAHAPLPGAPAAEVTSVPTAQQPVDEVERQRQKLMKHTPAKPSRLREAFVPSPSLLSDAGNESIFIASPLPATDLFDDMPDAEDLGLTNEDWAAVEALRNSAEWKAADAANVWPDVILTYESEEEGLSPE